MDQHPVPRNVTGFKFQLIGSMTLHQFIYLLFGLGVGFIFYKSPLGIFRFPLAGFAIFIGVAFAFLPIQERSLDIWVVNFVRSVFSPTEYVWQKENRIPLFLMPATTKVLAPTKQSKSNQEIARDTRAKLDAYLAKSYQSSISTTEQQEQNRIASLNSLFTTQPAVVLSSSPPITHNPSTLFRASPQPLDFARGKPTTTSSSFALVSGAVVYQNKPLEGVLVHVFDQKGGQIRLIKTDSSGKFASSLPLVNGNYKVEVEDPKKAYSFRPFHFLANGQPLHPWLITPMV